MLSCLCLTFAVDVLFSIAPAYHFVGVDFVYNADAVVLMNWRTLGPFGVAGAIAVRGILVSVDRGWLRRRSRISHGSK